MRVLKFFLYITLFLSFAWSVLVFSGPFFLGKLLTSYSDGRITPHNISISPKLDINIGRLDILVTNKESSKPVLGVLQSVNLSWSILPDKPFLEIQTGPTYLENVVQAKRTLIKTPSLQNLDVNRLGLNSEFSGVKFADALGAESLLIEGVYLNVSRKLLNISYRLEKVAFSNSLDVSTKFLKGEISEISLDTPLSSQALSLNFLSKEILSLSPNIKIVNLNGEIAYIGEKIDFTFTASEVGLADLISNIETINVKGLYKLGSSFPSLDFEFINGDISAGNVRFSSIKSTINERVTSVYDINIKGALETLDVFYSENFIGTVPLSFFEADALLNVPARDLNSKIKLILDGENTSGQANIEVELEKFKSYFNCALLFCEPAAITLKHKLTLDDEWIQGVSDCSVNYCNVGKMSHYVSTSNTNQFFEKLRQAKILNPVLIAYLYGAITSGTKVGSGHEVLFN